MRSVGVRELKERASEIVRRVRETQEEIDVTFRGEVVARVVPVQRPKARRVSADALWSDLDRLARDVGRRWPKGVSGTGAVSHDRRG